MHFVRRACYLKGHKLRLTFEDGSVRDVDLAKHLDGPVFEPLKDVKYFKRFRVHSDLDTVVWENGADFSPEFLYKIGVPLNPPQESKIALKARGRASPINRAARVSS